MIKVDAHALGILARFFLTKDLRKQQDIEVEFDMAMEDLAAGRRKGRAEKFINIVINMDAGSPFNQAYAQYVELMKL